MDTGFEHLMKKWEGFKDGHVRVVEPSIFNWFEVYGLLVIKEYCDSGEDTKLTYEVKENGITVEITAEQLLLCELDTEMLRVLQIAATTFIDSNDDGTVNMKLWFRGWKWEDK